MSAPPGMFGRNIRVPVIEKQISNGTHNEEKPKKTIRIALPARGLGEFKVPPDDDPSVLLGNRYLCRGDGIVLVSSSGMGKSSLSIQAAVLWALGRPFMGIKPNGCLRSLIMQSEDSDGDIGEVYESICYKLKLTEEERALVHERVVVVTDRVHRGKEFVAEVALQLATAKIPFDLVWINPLASFITGDATTQEATAEFLRAGLNGINTPGKFGYIIIQHTIKPSTDKANTKEKKWFEVMYDMAGSYDLVGWARAIISLRPTDTIGEFNLVLAKRGQRAGVTKEVPHGSGWKLESVIVIPLKHAYEKMTVPGIKREVSVIFWEPREEDPNAEKAPERKAGCPKKNQLSDFMGIFPTGLKNAIGLNQLYREALKIKEISKGSVQSLIKEAREKQIIVADSSNPNSTVYYIKPQIVVNEEADLICQSEGGQ